MARKQRWKLLFPLLVALMLISGLGTPQLVSADEGINVSNMSGTHAIATGASADGSKVCTVWSTFVGDSQAFIRIYDVNQGTWSPALGTNAFQLSNAGNGGVAGTRCAIDSNGTVHAAWQQKSGSGPLQVMHRYLPNGGNWSGIATVAGNGDAPDLAADNAGRVWLSHFKFQGDGNSGQVHLFRWEAGNWDSRGFITASGLGALPRVGVDNGGFVHLAWQNGGSGRGYAFYNSNTGQFSSELTVPGSNNSGNFSMAVNRDNGDVHIIYSKNFSEIHYAKKTGFGSTSFSGGDRTIANVQDRALDPHIAWSSAQLFVVFDNGNKDRIDYITSGDQGANWSGITNVADPNGAQNPWVAASTNGVAFVAYAHRNDGTVYFKQIGDSFVPEAERCARFADVRNSDPACAAITNLTGRGVINGYATNPPTFGPNDAVQRAQMAAFLVRDLQWQNRPKSPNTFTDFGQLDGELRDASLVLANACANTSDPNTCVAKGYGNGRFGPNDEVTYAQVISFITRAYVFAGRWSPQGAPHPYGGVPSVHEPDVRTFYAYTDGLGGVPDGGAINWNSAAPRAWVARALYQAIQSPPTP